MDITANDIARIRESIGISRKKFAQQLKVSTGSVNNWERNQTLPSNPRVISKLQTLKRQHSLSPSPRIEAETAAPQKRALTEEVDRMKTILEGYEGLSPIGQQFVREFISTQTTN